MRKVNVSNSLRKLFSIIMVSIFIIAAMPVDYIRADEPRRSEDDFCRDQ